MSGFFSDPDAGDTLSFTASGLPAGLAISAGGAITGTPAQDGTYQVTVTASDGSLTADSGFTLVVADAPSGPVQTPFPGPGAPVLGQSLMVDATNFDAGGQGVSWNDDPGLDGGNTSVRSGRDVELYGSQLDVAYVEKGEWVEYTIDVAEAGTYDLSVVAKTPIAGNSVTVSIEGGPALAKVALPDSNGASKGFGGTSFAATAPVEIDLAAGQQTLRFAFDGTPASNGYLLDMRSFSLDRVETVDPEPPTSSEAVGQAGAVSVTQASAGQWHTVSFAEALENPAVVMGPISFSGSQQATMRVRNVTDLGFEYQLDEWNYLDGGHTVETISWLAMESGVHEVGGQTIAAGVASASETASSVGFGTGFGAAPVVLAQGPPRRTTPMPRPTASAASRGRASPSTSTTRRPTPGPTARRAWPGSRWRRAGPRPRACSPGPRGTTSPTSTRPCPSTGPSRTSSPSSRTCRPRMGATRPPCGSSRSMRPRRRSTSRRSSPRTPRSTTPPRTSALSASARG